MRAFLVSIMGCLLTAAAVVESFATTAPLPAAATLRKSGGTVTALASSATDNEASSKKEESSSSSSAAAAPSKLLKRERYIASNRFSVRSGKESKFEKRWANRKSRLAELDGFRYFHLMRRVTLGDEDGAVEYDGGVDGDSMNGNYVSLTVWEDKSNFNAWRKGDAFREAHGGTSVGAFVSTMVSSALVLKGPPKPAFYDGLLVQSLAPEFLPETVDGWRNVAFPEEKGKTLPAECFVASNQFFVPRENAAAFEQRWKNRESKLKFCDGFVSFAMMRRDAKTKTHGSEEMDENSEPTYVSFTIWKDRASFDAWRSGSAFSQVHGGKPAGGAKESGEKPQEEPPKKPPQARGPPLWNRPPEPIFYEGTLVISTADGA
mmetsp:Transcript_2339/g.6272  ORF Transcript_2339/g.6272 Transcript_2339/m.6272 type:complete len:376 (-) Transcript_2339:2084-3211(-)